MAVKMYFSQNGDPPTWESKQMHREKTRFTMLEDISRPLTSDDVISCYFQQYIIIVLITLYFKTYILKIEALITRLWAE